MSSLKNYRITVSGKVYDVQVECLDDSGAAAPCAPPVRPAASANIAAPVSAPAFSGAPKAAAGPGAVPSPLAGKIVAVAVKAGDTVTEGDQILTIEAMKMNTHIFAPTSGKIQTIHVNVGDGVEEGQALLTLG
jgi:biotin carboxyl carrier protein